MNAAGGMNGHNEDGGWMDTGHSYWVNATIDGATFMAYTYVNYHGSLPAGRFLKSITAVHPYVNQVRW